MRFSKRSMKQNHSFNTFNRSANRQGSPGAEFFKNTTRVYFRPDASEELNAVTIFLSILGIKETLWNYRLML